MLIDRGTCQTYADQGIGDATDCWKPVYINLMFTDLIVFWLELLFLAMPQNRNIMKAEKVKKRAAFEQQVMITIPSILFVLADPLIKQWMETSSLPYIFVYIFGNIAEFSAFLWWFVVHFSDEIRDYLHDHKHDPSDVSYLSTVKSSLQTVYLLGNEHIHDHDD